MPGYSIPHYSWAELLSFDKFIHFLLFAVLAILFMRGFKMQNQFVFLMAKATTFVLLFCIIYGGMLELMQNYFFEDRSGSWFDFIANGIGCFAGIAVYNFLKKKDAKIFGYRV